MSIKIENDLIILEDVFTTFGRTSYPVRVYGKYDWSEIKNSWVISKVCISDTRKTKIKFILTQINI